MAVPQRRSDLDEQQLIDKHIGLDHERCGGRADARLKVSGVDVWAIITYLNLYEGDADRVAREYELAPEEMAAALAYYRRYKKYIDARILLNDD